MRVSKGSRFVLRSSLRYVQQLIACNLNDRDPFSHAKIFFLQSRGKFINAKKTGEKCQIINLGCGFDTLYWRLRDAGHFVQNFIELDFPTVTAKKCYQIKRNKILLDKIHAEGERCESLSRIM